MSYLAWRGASTSPTFGLIRQNAGRLHAWQPVRKISESKAKHPSLAASSFSVPLWRCVGGGPSSEARRRSQERRPAQSRTRRLTSDIQRHSCCLYQSGGRARIDPDLCPEARSHRQGLWPSTGSDIRFNDPRGWEVASALPTSTRVVALHTFSPTLLDVFSWGNKASGPYLHMHPELLLLLQPGAYGRYYMPPDYTHHTQALTHSCSPTSTSTSHPHPYPHTCRDSSRPPTPITTSTPRRHPPSS